MGKGKDAGGTPDPQRRGHQSSGQDSVRSPRSSLLVCDRLVTASLLFLIFFTPLAFGSVHPWAFSLMEGMIFLLVAVWMSKLLLGARGQQGAGGGREDTEIHRHGHRLQLSPSPRHGVALTPSLWLLLPLLLFFSFLLFQLLPLPPALLRLLSPATYELYAKSLPGWPEQMPYGELPAQTPDSGGTDLHPTSPQSWVLLPALAEVRQGTPVPLNNTTAPNPQPSTSLGTLDSMSGLWRPLSLAPSLTRSDLLKLLAYGSLFFLVLLYPFGPSPRGKDEERFFRAVLLTILCSGLLIVCIGLVQQFTWNGKILWFFVPYDWGMPYPGGALRATGPFINPDHFANYLTLIFPLAFVGVLSSRFFAPQGMGRAFRLFCGFTVFLLLIGILLSLSRSGWISSALGVSILLGVFLSLPEEKRPALLRRSTRPRVWVLLTGLVLLLILALFFVGPSGRSQVDVRLEETVMQETSLWTRMAAWEDSLRMIRDFPLFGVGLGSWQELFPRYQRPPWSPTFYREAHNDYLELLAETGLVGLGLLAWFFWQGGRRLYQGLWTVSPRIVSVFAALVAALGIMAFHEFLDFNLQIPANAFLFTLLLGTALRLAGGGSRDPGSGGGVASLPWPLTPSPWPRLLMMGTGLIALLLFVLAFRQEGLPYPYDARESTSLAEAREILFSHPARSSSHLSLCRFLPQGGVPAELLGELEIALWLDPRNPSARDLYATSLLQQGRTEEGLRELSQSVTFAPDLSAHVYSSLQWMPSLSAKEQQAVEEGFKQAVVAGYKKAADGLGAFYTALDRFSEAGRVYEEAALQEGEADTQVRYLLNAGLAYARAGEREKAEACLHQATAIAPQDPRAYQYLATRVFAPQGDMQAAKAVIAAGIEQGTDPLLLYLALGEAGRIANDGREAKAALHQALALQPASFEAHFCLGLVYLQEKNLDRATLSLRKAADVNPSSVSAFYYLGLAEEQRYQFFAAEKAYARAATLAPDDMGLRRHYEDFLRKVAVERAQGKGL